MFFCLREAGPLAGLGLLSGFLFFNDPSIDVNYVLRDLMGFFLSVARRCVSEAGPAGSGCWHSGCGWQDRPSRSLPLASPDTKQQMVSVGKHPGMEAEARVVISRASRQAATAFGKCWETKHCVSTDCYLLLG